MKTRAKRNNAELLGVDQSTVGKRLKAMGKILKEGKWVDAATERQASAEAVLIS